MEENVLDISQIDRRAGILLSGVGADGGLDVGIGLIACKALEFGNGAVVIVRRGQSLGLRQRFFLAAGRSCGLGRTGCSVEDAVEPETVPPETSAPLLSVSDTVLTVALL
jgi:hypothetical protein